MRVHNTASKKNRLIKTLLLSSYVFLPIFKKNILYGSKDLIELKKFLTECLNREFENFSFYVGTIGSSNRKLTIMLLDMHGNSHGIVKYPLGMESEQFIVNEYDTLNQLKNINFLSIFLPRNFDLLELKDKKILFQENIFTKTSQLKNELNDFIINASIELAINTKQNGIKDYAVKLLNSLQHVEKCDSKIFSKINSILESLIKVDMPIVLLHGDFVLYNMQTDGSKLYLIDWEYSRMGLPLFDLFHFVFQGNMQIEKKSVLKSTREFFSKKNTGFYKKYLTTLNVDSKQIKYLFMIYLFDSLVFERKIRPLIKIEQSCFYKAIELINNEIY